MPAKKNSSAQVVSKGSQKAPGRFSGGSKKAILYLALVGIFIVCAYLAWRQVSARVLASAEYSVSAQQIEITPPPPWIHSDLSGEIYRDLSRHGPISIMDEDLTQRVADAFSRHPWIAKVQQVSKHYPARVTVDVIYREPVCMVELSGGLMPVDAEATLLPTADFSPLEASKYPRLIGVDRGPMGAVGGRWGDGRVVGGAEIAKALLRLWEKLNLQSIAALPPPETPASSTITAVNARRAGEYNYVIITRGGMRILWGPSPALNAQGKPTPEQKVNKLEQFAAEHGSLDYPGGPRELDLQKP